MLAALEMYWSKLGPRGTWDPHAHEWLGIVENGQPITEEFHVSPKGAFLVTIWIPVQKSGLAEWSVWVDNRKIAQGECATEDEAKKISLAVAMAVPL